MTFEAIADVVASNERIAAPVVALLVAWVLYGVLGKRFLGADDDFWPALRRRVIPLLAKAIGSSDLYVRTDSVIEEYAGQVKVDSLDTFEEHLEAMGYHRNPLASLKTYEDGDVTWQQDGSWAKRHGRVRLYGDWLRRSAAAWPIPGPGWLAGMLGRFTQALGDILATKQTDLALYVEDPDQPATMDDVVIVHIFAHTEANALNPLTAWRHFRAKGKDPQAGVQHFQRDLTTYAPQNGLRFQTAAAPDS